MLYPGNEQAFGRLVVSFLVFNWPGREIDRAISSELWGTGFLRAWMK
jgi:hypothetical protein